MTYHLIVGNINICSNSSTVGRAIEKIHKIKKLNATLRFHAIFHSSLIKKNI